MSSNPPYPVGAIANYMLDRGEEDGVPITHLKLQKRRLHRLRMDVGGP